MSRILIFACVTLLTAATAWAQQRTERGFTVEPVADGVYALIRREPASLWFTPNNVIIVGKREVIVVDANITSAQTREVLAALREITDKPVAYVINTHWHEDHIIGNRIYREAFPNVRFVAHRSSLKDLPEIGGANRKGTLQNGRGFVGLLESKLEKGESLAGGKITDEERTGYASDIKLIGSYLAESPNFEIILPDVPVDQKFEIDMGDRRVDVRYLGRAHTAADLVVHLPDDGIAITGDLLVHPVPLVGSTAFPLEYAATLEKLKALKAKTYIPGHGPVMRDALYLDKMIGLLTAIRERAKVAYKSGGPLDEMRRKFDLGDQQKVFAGESQHKNLIFRNYVTIPATENAHRHLSAAPQLEIK